MVVEHDPEHRIERALPAALQRLPLFPLPNVVLFPHALLPLHIFEERYRKMARDVLASHRFMVVSLIIGDGSEERGPPPFHRIAGVGEVVMAHELPDGRFNLVVRGRARVRIDQELVSDEPYRLVTATEMLDDSPSDPKELRDADASLRALVFHLADAIPEGGELLRQVVAAQETPLVDVLTAALVVDAGTRQRLLQTTDVLRRIERLSAEVVVMTARIGSPDRVN